MLVVRNDFQLQFGHAKEAIALWNEGGEIAKRNNLAGGSARILTDLVGAPYYTLILNMSYESLADFERSSKAIMSNQEWRAWYPKVAPLAVGGHREIFNVEV